MYTQCPACKTVFRLHSDQLNAARGQVRCSRCHTIFNARENLFRHAAGVEVNKKNTNTAEQERSHPNDAKASVTYAPPSPGNLVEGADIPSTPATPPELTNKSDSAEEETLPTVSKQEVSRDKTVSVVSQEERPQAVATSDALLPLNDGNPNGSQPANVDLPPDEQTTEKPLPQTGRAAGIKSASTKEDSTVDDGLFSLFHEQPIEPDAALPTEEDTLPQFKPDEQPTAEVEDALSLTQPHESTEEEASDPPPLFKFDSAITEPPIATDTDTDTSIITDQAETRKKKRRPVAHQHEELDLFAWSETPQEEQNDALLFRYLPEESIAVELIPDHVTPSAEPDTTERKKDKPQKPAQPHPGYTLPLEQEPLRSSLRGTFLWGIGILLMLAALALQYLYYHRITLAEEPRLRPLLAQMCQLTGCQLPPQRDLTRIELGKHLVQVHPRYTESLLITATLVNRADFPQPFPIVEVVMTDLQQKQVARRRFLPHEYLIGGDDGRILAPQTEVPLMLEVLDPGKDAVGFEFNFY